MQKKRPLLLAGIILLILATALLLIYWQVNTTPQITFDECASNGGEAWLVDLYHPDICPACAQYRACTNDCDSYLPACTACLEQNFPYPDICPAGKEKIGEITDAAIWFQCCR